MNNLLSLLNEKVIEANAIIRIVGSTQSIYTFEELFKHMQIGVRGNRSVESNGNLTLISDVVALEGGIFRKDYKPPPR